MRNRDNVECEHKWGFDGDGVWVCRKCGRPYGSVDADKRRGVI